MLPVKPTWRHLRTVRSVSHHTILTWSGPWKQPRMLLPRDCTLLLKMSAICPLQTALFIKIFPWYSNFLRRDLCFLPDPLFFLLHLFENSFSRHILASVWNWVSNGYLPLTLPFTFSFMKLSSAAYSSHQTIFSSFLCYFDVWSLPSLHCSWTSVHSSLVTCSSDLIPWILFSTSHCINIRDLIGTHSEWVLSSPFHPST